MTDIHPEAAEAIRIADKHLEGRQAEVRNALAMDIIRAINRLATTIAADCVAEGIAMAPKPLPPDGWMARCEKTGGRLFAHSKERAEILGREAYAPSPFEVMPLRRAME